jgi:DNA primase
VKITDDQIEQVREATDIVDLIGEHVRLRKRGRNYFGLCPFHTERSPSFSVFEEKAIFKCFGCGKAGDAFSFVMMLENLSFPEAVERLAKRANIDLGPELTTEERAQQGRRESIYSALTEAARWYYRTLRSVAGQEAMEYLVRRGLEDETIKRFGLGFAPDKSGSLTHYLSEKGYDEHTMEDAGIIAQSNRGDHYERFRGRVMFPVFSPTGKIVGFGGRILPGSAKEMAKYINSPDTEVYHKSQLLYGLYQSKDEIRRKKFAILVEGYADVISVFQAGFQNVVAASGTSLTTEQLNLLRRYTTNVVLLFDADQAGKNAAMRGIELAIQTGFDVSIVILPAGEDPDSFVRGKGPEAFGQALERRQTFIETKAQWFEEQGSFKDPTQLAAAVRSIVETVAHVPDAIKRAFFIQRLAERFHLSEQLLTIELGKVSRRNSEPRQQHRGRFEDRQPYPPEPEYAEASAESEAAIPPPELTLLTSLLLQPILVERIIAETEFNIDLVSDARIRQLIGYVLQQVEAGSSIDLAALIRDYRSQPEFAQVLISASIDPNDLSGQWDESEADSLKERLVTQARHSIVNLKRIDIEKRRDIVRRHLAAAQSQDEQVRYMTEFTQLSREFESLKVF